MQKQNRADIMFNSPCINEYIGKVVMLIINVDLQSKQSLHNL